MASLVDGLVMMLLLLPVALVAGIAGRLSHKGIGVVDIVALVGVLVVLAYGPVLHGRSGRTVGKNVMRLEVQDVATGAPIGVGRSVVRFLVLWLMGSICYLGYLSILLDKSGWYRGWHDLSASSRVVKTRTTKPLGSLLRR